MPQYKGNSEEMKITIPDVVVIPQCGLYAKTPDSLHALIDYLKSKGYEVNDTRNDCSLNKTPADVREKEGWALWYAHLDENTLQRKGECGSCRELISPVGIETHGHQCEKCGDVTYLKFQNRGRVRFSFVGDQRMLSDLTLVAHSYDPKTKRLSFYPDGSNFDEDEVGRDVKESYERLEKELLLFPDAFTRETVDNDEVLSTHHGTDSIFLSSQSKINVAEIFGKKYNFKIVKVFKGKKYGEFESLPVPESYNIYESWYWAPLKPSPGLHERIISAAGMVSDVGYYYQDGRTAFYDIHLQRMRLFVENFTTLDVKEWDIMIKEAPRDGPGMIRGIASFCHPEAVVENRPNVGNALAAMGKIMSGEPVTVKELYEGERGLREDPKGQRFVSDLVETAVINKMNEEAFKVAGLPDKDKKPKEK